MRKRKLSLHVAFITAAFLLHGCGGSDDPPAISPTTLTGVFLDSPVANVDYQTFADGVETTRPNPDTGLTVTDMEGQYAYVAGETVVFSIGDLAFPEVAAAGTVTPLDIADTNDPNDTEAVNMLRLLQTLDKDGDPSNGIEITDIAKANASPIESFDVPDEEFSEAVQTLISSGGQDEETTELVSSAEAVAHFEETLEDSGTTYNTLTGSWQLTSEEGDEAVIFHFLPDGRYLAMQWDEANGSEGFEYGTYSAADGSITFVTRENHDGDALTCNEDRGVVCDGTDDIAPGVWAYAFSDEGALVFTVEEADYSFNKLEATDSPVSGFWELLESKEIIFFTRGSATSSGYYFFVDYDSEDEYDTNFDLGTYTTSVDDGKAQMTLIAQKQYNDFGLQCQTSTSVESCDVYEVPYEVMNNQLIITNIDEGEDRADRDYFNLVFADDNAPANTAKLVSQKHYASDIAANENYGVEIEDDHRTMLETYSVDTANPSSFKASFTIDESATALTRGTDSSAGLETRLYAYYAYPADESLTLSVSLRLRYYGDEVTARFNMLSDLETEVGTSETVTLDTTDFTGDHTMEMAWNATTQAFDCRIDGVDVGSMPIANFNANAEVVAAGGYTFDADLFRRVRFRVETFNVTQPDDSALITVHMDEFSANGVVYDDFTGGLIDSDKWNYVTEER